MVALGSLGQAIGLVRGAGTLLVVGVPPRPATLPLPLVQDWELRVQGCANHTHADIVTAADIAAQGKLPAGEVISAVRPLSEAVAAFDEAARGSSGKVEIAVSA